MIGSEYYWFKKNVLRKFQNADNICAFEMNEQELWIHCDANTCKKITVDLGASLYDIIQEVKDQFNQYSHYSTENIALCRKRKPDFDESCEDHLPRSTTVKNLLNEKNFPGNSSENPIFVKRIRRQNVWNPVEFNRARERIFQRSSTFQALHEIFYQKFTRIKNKKAASCIPLMDTSHGTGKTEFSREFLNMYENFRDPSVDPDFLDEIKSARRIEVNIHVYGNKSIDIQIINEIQRTLSREFVPDIAFLEKYHKTSTSLIKNAIRYGGPIFMVFKNVKELLVRYKKDPTNQNSFWTLYAEIFSKWCRIKQFYFVFIGECSEMRLFPEFDQVSGVKGTLCIRRLPLEPLNSDSVAEIIQAKFLKRGAYYQKWKLDEKKLLDVSEKVCCMTRGIPTHVRYNISNVNTLEDMIKHGSISCNNSHVQDNYNLLENYSEEVQELLQSSKTQTPIDLTREIIKRKGIFIQKIYLHQIATDAFFSWTGNVKSALLNGIPEDEMKKSGYNMDFSKYTPVKVIYT